VDDNVDAAQSLAMLLETSGHSVRTAYDGEAALEAARAHRPDIAFLDIGLPKLDGYELAKCLRHDVALGHITLVAMTGYGQAADRERARVAGFDEHLIKPVDFSKVERLLDEVAARRSHNILEGRLR
jgi:CheY-like chemotaxis protein